MLSRYTRGMVYWTSLPQTYGQATQGGRRPCIIISNDIGNTMSDILTVIPCTTNLDKADTQPTHLAVRLHEPSVALAENIQTVNKRACDAFIGILDSETIKKLDEVIKIALGLISVPNKATSESTKENNTPKEEKVEEKEEKTTKKQKSTRLTTKRQKKKFLEDYTQYGPQYCMVTYSIPSVSAVYARVQIYKKVVDK